MFIAESDSLGVEVSEFVWVMNQARVRAVDRLQSEGLKNPIRIETSRVVLRTMPERSIPRYFPTSRAWRPRHGGAWRIKEEPRDAGLAEPPHQPNRK
jgi:hypothetical protein